MRRNLLAVLSVTVAAALATGCSTVADGDVAARVGDAELTIDELEPLVVAVNPTAEPTSADAARNTISIWLLVEAMRARFAADGIEVTDADREAATGSLSSGLPGWADLDEDVRSRLVDWQSVLLVLAEQPVGYREEALAEVDVEVASRFGTFQPDVGVIPLGLSSDAILG